MSTYPLASSVRTAAGKIDAAKVSISKWNPVRDLLAEALNARPDDVYPTTISKPGNLSVRLEQSARARNAPVVAAMYTGDPREMAQLVESARKQCQGRRLILIFEDATGWTLSAIVKPAAQLVPSILQVEYPAATVVNC